MAGSSEGARRRRDSALFTLGCLIALAFALAVLYSAGSGTGPLVPGRMVTAALIAGAATMAGGLLGFLFGIPRTFAVESIADTRDAGGVPALRQPEYRPNTSLEQISDWLTKILVGVGLTQITTIQVRYADLCARLGQAFGGRAIDEIFAGALVAMLLVAGFLFGFLWTRIYLPGAFRAADLDAVVGEVKEELTRQADLDAHAVNLAHQQIDAPPGQPAVAEDSLAEVLAAASANARLFVFERARENRARNWQSTDMKPKMERSIPVLRALARIDGASPMAHRYYGQLGFALKDQVCPDWKASADALTTAIRIRGPAGDFGYTYYELNRAICHVMLDTAFEHLQPTGVAPKAEILADIRTAWQAGLEEVIRHEAVLAQWLALNGVSEEALSRG